MLMSMAEVLHAPQLLSGRREQRAHHSEGKSNGRMGVVRTDPPIEEDLPVANQVGNRLRILRLQRSVSLRALATTLGISSSALSQLETGRRSPSLERLHQIVAALDFPLSAVFEETSSPAVEPGEYVKGEKVQPPLPEDLPGIVVQRGVQAPKVVLKGNIEWRTAAPLQVSGLDLLRVTYPPGAHPAGPVTHSGIEIVHVVKGLLRFEVGDERSDLGDGDSIMYSADVPHRVSNYSDEPASALWIVVEGACQLKPVQEP